MRTCGLWLVSLLLIAHPCQADDAEQAAVGKLRGVPSNLQKNRDGTVRFIRFSKSIVRDEHLAHLQAFKQLDYLAIVTPQITDQGIAHLAGLDRLDTLYLSQTQLTDAGLTAVTTLVGLERLYLDGTKITSEGLEQLRNLKQLHVLSLRGTRVDGSGLAHLAALDRLQELDLADTKVGNHGLESLAALGELKYLDLSRTTISAEGLAKTVRLTALEHLVVSHTQLAVVDLEMLAALPKLRRVTARGLEISPAAAAGIQDKLPKVAFHFTPAGPGSQTALQRFRAARPARLKRATKLTLDRAVDAAEAGSGNDKRLAAAAERFGKDDAKDIPDFQRHVVPLLGRLGCNGRNCHGSFQGRGGFRLSMFGYDFAADAEALADRIDVDSPDDSLILLKPTLAEDHEGGKRFARDGWQYRVLRQWVAAGANGRAADAAHLERLEVRPNELRFERLGQTARLHVEAVWSDGSREDVTCLTRFETKDDAVATVSPDGEVRCVGRGDTHIIALYDSGVAAVPVLLPVSKQVGERYPKVEPPTEIDRRVIAKLAKLGIVPADVCDDATFLRRVSLDIAGTLPTPDEVTQFVADTAADKRSRVIDELLAGPAHVEWWTNLLCDLTGSNPQFLGSTDMNRPAAEQWRQWMRRRVQDNAGWDEIVAGILLAESRRPGQTYRNYVQQHSDYMRRKQPADFTVADNPMHYYWFRSNLVAANDRALSFGYVFLGVRLQCAQCHKHPYDRWSKEDFERFTQFFTRVKTGVAPDARDANRRLKTRLGVPVKLNTAALRRQMYMRVAAEGQPIPWAEVYLDPPQKKPHFARVPGGRDIDLNPYRDPREPLVDWLVDPANPFFARAIVNRIWMHYFGSGIVDPPDDFNQANPPSNRALLDYLAVEFVRRGYNLRWLHREITNSRTYQRSWQVNATNRADDRNFSRARIRRLPAEVLMDAVLQATSADKALRPAVRQLPQLLARRKIAQHPISIQARGVDYSLLVFGKPLRMTNCDCERQQQPSLLQALYLRNDNEMLQHLERADGWLLETAGKLGQALERETAAAPTKRGRPQKRAGKPRTGPNGSKPDAANPNGAAVTAETVNGLIDAAYLRTLSRPPSDDERTVARGHLTAADNTVEGLRDLMWVLLNTQEFVTNH